MSFKKSVFHSHLRHSVLILLRYQQIYIYLPGIAILILLPVLFSIKDPYFNILYSINFLIVLWLFSPFFLNMFSFSSEDARSLSLFPVMFKNLIAARNVLNFSLLVITFGLSIVLMALFYPKTNTRVSDLIVLSLMHLLPVISIGNLTSRSSLSWTGKSTFSWKGIYVILILYFNILIFQISKYNFYPTVFILIIGTVFLLYLGFYYLSFKKIVREISTYFSSIREK